MRHGSCQRAPMPLTFDSLLEVADKVSGEDVEEYLTDKGLLKIDLFYTMTAEFNTDDKILVFEK